MHSSLSVDRRLKFIDMSKGIGVLLVICSHFYAPLMSWSYPFFIPIFFIISGYCTTHTIVIQKKFKKLVIPYFLFSIILIIVSSFNKSLSPFDYFGVLYSRLCLYPLGNGNNILFMNSGNQPLWFLTSMFMSFILFRFLQNSKRKLLCFCVFIIITYLFSFLPILLPWSFDTAFLMALFIYCGVLIREMNLLQKIDFPSLLCLVLFYVILWRKSGYINLSIRNYGNSLFVLFLAAVIGSLLLMKVSILSSNSFLGGLSAIGRHSLPIFCLHMPFISIYYRIIDGLHIDMNPSFDGLICVVCVVAISYPIALLFDRFILIKMTK